MFLKIPLFLYIQQDVLVSWGNGSREFNWNTEDSVDQLLPRRAPSRLEKQVGSSCGVAGVNLILREVLITSCLMCGCENNRTRTQGRVLPCWTTVNRCISAKCLPPLWALS